MVTLFCVVVGEEQGNAFPVDIDASKTVGHLKKAIRNEKPNTITDDADKLELFLAKKGNEWLTKEEVAAMKLDEHGQLKDFEHMDEMSDVVEFFAEDFKRKKGEIHVLVVVPNQEAFVSNNILVRNTLEVNGLSFTQRYLERHELVNKIKRTLEYYRFMVISSSPATGKTSLIQLAHKHLQFPCRFIHCKEQQNPYEALISIGIDLERQTTSISELCVVVLDDAHNYYSNKDFWTDLIKYSPEWLPEHVRFIISATHNLTKFNVSPVEIHSLPGRISTTDLLITDEEANELFNISSNDISWSPILRTAIMRECKGVIGAIRLSMFLICERFYQCEPTEAGILQYFFSEQLTSQLHRIFSVNIGPVQDLFRNFLMDMFVNLYSREPMDLNEESKKVLLDLQKGGALVEIGAGLYCFSSPLAQRFYFHYIFPDRSSDIPKSLIELVEKSIQNMSSTVLKNATTPGSTNDFPKETVFQHEFMKGLSKSLHPSCFICPELSRVFPEDASCMSDRIDGEIDFYIDGTLRWGIELVVNGAKISEHASRFSEKGKYYPLRVKDYAIVDFRRSFDGYPTNIATMNKRISVFFSSDGFRHCVCNITSSNNQHSVELELKS